MGTFTAQLLNNTNGRGQWSENYGHDWLVNSDKRVDLLIGSDWHILSSWRADGMINYTQSIIWWVAINAGMWLANDDKLGNQIFWVISNMLRENTEHENLEIRRSAKNHIPVNGCILQHPLTILTTSKQKWNWNFLIGSIPLRFLALSQTWLVFITSHH